MYLVFVRLNKASTSELFLVSDTSVKDYNYITVYHRVSLNMIKSFVKVYCVYVCTTMRTLPMLFCR